MPAPLPMRVELPEPSRDERAHSDRLCALIREEIRGAGGAIGFERYMELALYAPGLGYYSAGATKFGAAGDYVTAPELGFLFARCLARAIARVLRETGGDILELGPGTGALAADLLQELERLGALPQRYRLLERSADLRERQRARLHARCPGLLDRAEWINGPPQQPWRGALIANEVVDALPVCLFALRDGGLFERAVGVEGDAFVWRERPADHAFMHAVHKVVGATPEPPRPYLSEVRLLLAPWFQEVTGTFAQGTAWFIDYGYPREEFYAPSRQTGTLRCHYRHRAHDDPLILTGLQDITAWVDFDALHGAAADVGFTQSELCTQARFLVEHGLEDVFADAHAEASDESARYRLAQEAKRLMLPGEMGEAFRVMAHRKHPASA
jgi:SAM-dependent MidA family methyltransferase